MRSFPNFKPLQAIFKLRAQVSIASASHDPRVKDQTIAEIEPLVRQASEAEKGDAAHKKLARDRVRAAEYLKRLPPVSVARIVDHIDHVVKLAGIDHVGIGSDFDGVQAVPRDLRSVADLPNLTKELVRRGYSESDIDKILGGNMLRVMEEVQKK